MGVTVEASAPGMRLEVSDEALSPAQLEAYHKKIQLYDAAEREIEALKKSAVGEIVYPNEYSMQFRTVVMVPTAGMTSGQTLQGPDTPIPIEISYASPDMPSVRVSKAVVGSAPVRSNAAAMRKTGPRSAVSARTPVLPTVTRPQPLTPRPPGPPRPTLLSHQTPSPRPAVNVRAHLQSPRSTLTPIHPPTTTRIGARPTPVAASAPAPPPPASKGDDDDEIEIIGTKKVPGAPAAAGKGAPSAGGASAAKDDSKLFPSLSVVARPVHVDPYATGQAKRQELDGIVKTRLVLSSAQFAEWLMQEGIVRTSQSCAIHSGTDMQPIQLKLGKATDETKFPHSGGYVWIGECCPASFVSIFNGSIFGGSPHPPTTLLKLIYHWACQTPVTNVIQWVKIDRHYLKSFYTLMRSVCTYAVQTGIKQCGVGGGALEVGVISLGTTSTDGKKREVRVEVLGIYDQTTKRIRLRAIEPVAGNKNRFMRILEPLKAWVHPSARILTDYTVDRSTLHTLGFSRVVQKSPGSIAPDDKATNVACMDYLRKTVPKVFQNTLSLLSTNMIQQFLDELTWREIWAPNNLASFQNIIKDIRGLTLAETPDPILSRLAKVAANPFGNWGEILNKPATVAQRRTVYNPGAKTPAGPARHFQNRKRPLNTFKESPKAPEPKKPLLDDEDATYFGRCAGKNVDFPKAAGVCFFCPISGCTSSFSNNLDFGKHLFSHVDNKQQLSELSDHVQCKYCFKVFPTPFAMQSHVTSAHIENTKRIMCMICEEEFNEASLLLGHLREKHSAYEMPYVCELCEFRTSSHRDIVDHFHQEHEGSSFVMCHLCLKTFNVKGERNPDRLNYVYHMKEHQKAGVGRKFPCNRCALVFLTNNKFLTHLKQHNTTVSSETTPFSAVEYPVLEELEKLSSKKLPVGDGILLVRTYPGLTFGYLDDSLLCFECKEPMTKEGHFSSYLCCANCRYATCCSASMDSHRKSAHSVDAVVKEAPELVFSLAQTMHCACGFMSSSGNVLGKHLKMCGKNKCYPSKEAAEVAIQMEKSASFPPLVILEESEKQNPDETWYNALRAACGQKKDAPPPQQKDEEDENDSQNVLRLLGLQRKERIESAPSLDGLDAGPDPVVETSTDVVAAPVDGEGAQTAVVATANDSGDTPADGEAVPMDVVAVADDSGATPMDES